ncbi:MAG TPA: saccharopine dehydrogenase NADP-binding domain-containing protein, partial [Candidatus Cybelea sp.]|nr:saccharopine dehydrogenase NADP-binding domain-containing protein [Candidatus Cybelea sp.]
QLVELLEGESRLTLIVAGRALEKAKAFCKARGATQAELMPARFDREHAPEEQLRALAPDLVVDASGPFQAYGEQAYGFVQACIEQQIHYLDLADGSDFVAGITVCDARAREAGVFALSGVSTFPVLTAAAVRHLSRNMRRIDHIRGGIAPSPYAQVGENVIRAIASYAGKPVRLRRNGTTGFAHPFTEQAYFIVAPPGSVPLKRTLFSLVDVPDLCLLPELWPEVKSVWMGAGPVPRVLHRALIGFSWLVRLKLLPSLSPLAPLMVRAINRIRWGEHRGGLIVEIQGENVEGQNVTRSWHLVAEGDDGPFIPSMAVAALVGKLLAGRPPRSGARAALNELEL